MTFYQDNLVTIYKGDCRKMAELPDDSVHCVVTSPPYWGLRKYKVDEDLIWDAKDGCQHEWGKELVRRDRGTAKGKTAQVGNQLREVSRIETKQGNFCLLCGAWKGQLGLEPTIELYIQHLVEIFREVKRVLREDGTLWVNIGDSMAGSGGAHKENHANPGISNSFKRQGVPHYGDLGMPERYLAPKGLKPLDLCGIPQRLQLSLQADGWYWRQTVVWYKPNPMPESVNGWRWERHKVKVGNNGRGQEAARNTTKGRPQQDHDGREFKPDRQWADCPGCPKCSPTGGYVLRKGSWRPTESHEYILMLTKTNSYYGDREAVAEPQSNNPSSIERRQYKASPHSQDYFSKRDSYYDWDSYAPNNILPSGRNLRSVWEFPTEPFPRWLRKYGDHFATFPEKLPEICIKASTSEAGVCPKCGAPWARIVEGYQTEHDGITAAKGEDNHNYKRLALVRQHLREHGMEVAPSLQTLGWKATCKCNSIKPPVPAIVLDPFMGTGTTLWVAKKLGRKAVGYDISEDYCRLALERNRQGVLG
jgi:DNA modification methylase